MKSKWFHLKPQAISMRKRGNSLRDIEDKLGIPRSTLSGWLKTVTLSQKHLLQLEARRHEALVKARREAVKWHNSQKAERLEVAKNEALACLEKVGNEYHAAWELALAFLYLGEGAKKATMTSLGSSDVQILRFFVRSVTVLYSVPVNEMKCELHLRADQNPDQMKKYWSRNLGIPLRNFGAAIQDIRTAGKPTYPDYKGVCVVRVSRVAIQRKLVYIAKEFCEEVAAK